MSDTVIRVENLGKKYIIGHQKRERYTALRDVLADGTKSLGRRLLKPFGKRVPDPGVEDFWALKDVSFEIKQGDRVGIIGRNGAGKSTLLKILSRITEPTNGRISINGRVASLLEVGTGFHPELTGRENIYLNGAILGMSKAEIKKKFDEIVAFAEVEKFLDTPVKRYSSGMYVRLAFAVAAHLEPDILVVDEVLAVGDAQFQKKCLGKMKDVGGEGRTVLFVSHNMGMIDVLCNRCILLNKGEIVADGESKQITELYMGFNEIPCLQNFKSNSESDFTFLNVSITTKNGEIISWINEGEDFYINFQFQIKRILWGVEAGVQCYPDNSTDVIFATTLSDSVSKYASPIEPGIYSANLLIRGDRLLPGLYYFSLFSHIPYKAWLEERPHAVCLTIKQSEQNDIRKYARDKCGFFKIQANCQMRRVM